MAPCVRVRIKRSEIEQSGVTKDSQPRDLMQNSRMFRGAGNSDKSGHDSRPSLPGGGYRDGPPIGRAKGRPRNGVLTDVQYDLPMVCPQTGATGAMIGKNGRRNDRWVFRIFFLAP